MAQPYQNLLTQIFKGGNKQETYSTCFTLSTHPGNQFSSNLKWLYNAI